MSTPVVVEIDNGVATFGLPEIPKLDALPKRLELHGPGATPDLRGLGGVKRVLGAQRFSVNGKSDNGTAPLAVICTSCSSFTP